MLNADHTNSNNDAGGVMMPMTIKSMLQCDDGEAVTSNTAHVPSSNCLHRVAGAGAAPTPHNIEFLLELLNIFIFSNSLSNFKISLM